MPKVTEAVKAEINKLAREGKKSREIASIVGVSKSTVNDVLAPSTNGQLSKYEFYGNAEKAAVELDHSILEKVAINMPLLLKGRLVAAMRMHAQCEAMDREIEQAKPGLGKIYARAAVVKYWGEYASVIKDMGGEGFDGSGKALPPELIQVLKFVQSVRENEDK